MDHLQSGRMWEANADAWTVLSRAGYDVYRDHLNTPAFLSILPDVNGSRGLDIGCGEGHNTRLLARRGARMTGIDISESFIRHAREFESHARDGIEYAVASAVELPFGDEVFAFATGFMSFMDIPETERVLSEAHRVLKPGGFLQFSIAHPCFDTPHRRNLRDDRGRTRAIEVGGYFETGPGTIEEWTFGAAPATARTGLAPFRIPKFHRTLSQWFNLLIEQGFRVERLGEPKPGDEVVTGIPSIQDAQVVAYFLHIRARKDVDVS